jgi:uncharacterized protein (UPF0218 family)
MMSRMPNRGAALLLVLALTTTLIAEERKPLNEGAEEAISVGDVKSQVSQMKPGAFIEIRFTDGRTARGYLSHTEADGFTYRVGNPKKGTERRTTFPAVKSVKVVQRTHTNPIAWIAAGAIVGVVVVAVAILLIERHNEGN